MEPAPDEPVCEAWIIEAPKVNPMRAPVTNRDSSPAPPEFGLPPFAGATPLPPPNHLR